MVFPSSEWEGEQGWDRTQKARYTPCQLHDTYVCLGAQSCPTLCDPMDCSFPGSPVLGDSPGKDTGVGCHAPPPGDLPKPGIEPRSLVLQADSLLTEPHGKPKDSRVGGLSLLQRIFLTQESNQGLLHCRWILYQLSYQGSPGMIFIPQFRLYGEEFRLHAGHDGEPQGTFRKEMPLSCCTQDPE